MTKEYEFAYQSPKQKLVLLGLKLLVAGFIIMFIYSLGWQDIEQYEKLKSISGIVFSFYAYSNLLRVKVEIQELFIPPIDILFAKELIFISLIISFYADYLRYFA